MLGTNVTSLLLCSGRWVLTTMAHYPGGSGEPSAIGVSYALAEPRQELLLAGALIRVMRESSIYWIFTMVPAPC